MIRKSIYTLRFIDTNRVDKVFARVFWATYTLARRIDAARYKFRCCVASAFTASFTVRGRARQLRKRFTECRFTNISVFRIRARRSHLSSLHVTRNVAHRVACRFIARPNYSNRDYLNASMVRPMRTVTPRSKKNVALLNFPVTRRFCITRVFEIQRLSSKNFEQRKKRIRVED